MTEHGTKPNVTTEKPKTDKSAKGSTKVHELDYDRENTCVVTGKLESEVDILVNFSEDFYVSEEGVRLLAGQFAEIRRKQRGN